MILRLLLIALATAIPTWAAAESSAARSTAQINGALDSFFGGGGTTKVDPAAAAAVDASKFAFSYEPSVSEQVRTEFIDACAPSGDAATRDQLSAFVDQMTPEFRQKSWIRASRTARGGPKTSRT